VSFHLYIIGGWSEGNRREISQQLIFEKTE